MEEQGSLFNPEMGKQYPLSILLAEDNESNKKLALIMLDRLGYHADVVSNGLEVLEALRQKSYNVVLMDVQMPEMDGMEATKEIRRSFAIEKQPRIIAMTADAMEEDRKRCYAAGMDDYISKPVQVQELINALYKTPIKETVTTTSSPNTPEPYQLDMKSPHPDQCEEEPNLVRNKLFSEMEILDLAALKRTKDMLGKQADVMFPELLQSFFNDGIKLLAEARQALQEGNAQTLRRASHTLKSISVSFGAVSLSTTAREIESLAIKGTLNGAAELIDIADVEFSKARMALKTLH
jgi:CheY-like chemotaxis protein